MNGNGKPTTDTVLSWPKRLLSADDLRRHWTGQGVLELLPRTVVTPLAVDELRSKGVRLTWQTQETKTATTATGAWSYAIERPDAATLATIKALERDGIDISALELRAASPAEWAKQIGETVARSTSVVAFCEDAGLVACVANKLAGVRAATVGNVAQAKRARTTLGVNLVVIATPGPTFFELRQMLRTVCQPSACPEALAGIIKELDGHAHR